MTNVLVTGGKGFIGRHLVEELNKRNIFPVIVDLVDGNDIRTYDFKELKFDTIFHLAARRSVPDSFKDPAEYFSTNVWGTYRLVSLFPDAKFINISSSSAETLLSPYAVSKYLSEEFCRLHKNLVNLRLFNVFGEGQTSDNVIPNMIRKILEYEPVVICGDGKQARDFTYVKDVVKEIIWHGEDTVPNSKYDIDYYDVGYNYATSVNSLFTMIASYFDYGLEPVYQEKRKGDFDLSIAKDKLHIQPVGFWDGLKNTMEWWK